MERQQLIKKIEQLPPDLLAEVEKFVESIASDRQLDRDNLPQTIAAYSMVIAATDINLPLTEKYRNSIKEIVHDVLEEAGLSRAIDEGLRTDPATREEIFHILDNAQ